MHCADSGHGHRAHIIDLSAAGTLLDELAGIHVGCKWWSAVSDRSVTLDSCAVTQRDHGHDHDDHDDHDHDHDHGSACHHDDDVDFNHNQHDDHDHIHDVDDHRSTDHRHHD